MCGIAGVIQTAASHRELSRHQPALMDSLLHRGPDSKGSWHNEAGNLLLLHRRLAIQDVSPAGHQPMQSNSGRFVIAFNGEIYNFVKLRSQLSSLNFSFEGHSDTEVILAAIEAWGLDKALAQLEGMFAIALYDQQQDELHLIRDRIGEKPLYYTCHDGDYVFASELKAILAVLDKPRKKVSEQALGAYFKYGYVPAPLSMVQGVFKLGAGQKITLPLAKATAITSTVNGTDPLNAYLSKWWSLPQTVKSGLNQPINDSGKAINQLEEILTESVVQQSIADVPLGCFLSGGVDSSLVTALLQHNLDASIDTFTIGFKEKQYDESSYAGQIARHLGTSHTVLELSESDLLGLWPAQAGMIDEPLANASIIPSYAVSKLARQHVTVCLSGDGGDELFGGYNRYVWTLRVFHKLANTPVLLKKLFATANSPRLIQCVNKLLQLMQKTGLVGKQSNIDAKLLKLAEILPKQHLEDIYDHLLSFWHSPPTTRSTATPSVVAPFCEKGHWQSDNFYQHSMACDQTYYLAEDNLAKVDRSAMAVSLETRLPLLDKNVIEFSWRIPSTLKIREGETKWILRQVLYKHVPRELIERPKMGFTVPVAQWLSGPLRGWAESLLATLPRHSLLDKKTITNCWDKLLQGQAYQGNKVWAVLVLLEWCERHDIEISTPT